MVTTEARYYAFDDFVVRENRRNIWRRGGEPVILAPKTLDVFWYLFSNRNRAVSRGDLHSAIWPETTVEDNNIDQHISKLRRILRDADARSRIELVPRYGYKLVAEIREIREEEAELLLAKPTRLSFSAEIPREQETEEPPVTASGPLHRVSRIAAQRGKRALTRRIAVAALILVMLVLGVPRLNDLGIGGPEEVEAQYRSIAVLPAKALSATDNDETLNVDYADAVITKLTNDEGIAKSGIVVLPTERVLRYKDSDQSATEVGRQLNVDVTLISNYRRSGETTRFTAQLVRTRDGGAIWARSFETKIPDLPGIRNAVSQQVAEVLVPSLVRTKPHAGRPASPRPAEHYSDNTAANKLYSTGRFFWNKRSPDDLKKAIEYFNQLIESNRNDTKGLAGLADCYVLLGSLGYSELPPEEAFPKAKAAAVRALEIDKSLAEAHASLGLTLLLYDWDWNQADKELRKAIRQSSEQEHEYATARQWYANYLTAQGRFDEAIVQIERATDIEPVSLIINATVGWTYYFARNYDEAIRRCEKTLEMDPNFYPAHAFLSFAYEQKGMLQKAIDEIEKAKELSGNNPVMIAQMARVRAIGGDDEYARDALKQLEAISRARYVSPYCIAIVYAGLDDKDKAFEWLERAIAERSSWMIYLKVEPMLDNLRSDPRFADLLRRVGLADEYIIHPHREDRRVYLHFRELLERLNLVYKRIRLAQAPQAKTLR